MAKKSTAKKSKKSQKPSFFEPLKAFFRRIRRRAIRAALIAVAAVLLWVVSYAIFPVPGTFYMMSERGRLGSSIDYQWVRIEDISPHLARSVVAAEDANFCEHWGFDLTAIRAAIEDGANRGASTISQQTTKNAFLWHGRTWFRKALEALMTPVVEVIWSKERILEVYMNIAEFDEGVFGAEAASRHYFGVGPEELSALQAARLAAILPAPKHRSASRPGAFVKRRTAQIIDGAATIAQDGRSDCFEH